MIGVTEGSLETDERRAHLPVVNGTVPADIDRDVLLLAMIDRFGKGTGTGLGFVQGFRLRDGAIASTANAVCENIVIVGTNPTDMAVAANHLASLGGGKVVVRGGKVDRIRRAADLRPSCRRANGRCHVQVQPRLRGDR